MKLRRPVGSRVFSAVFGAAMLALAIHLVGLAVTAGSIGGRIFSGFWALMALFVAGVSARTVMGRFEVDVDRTGWSVRANGFDGTLRWAEISAVVVQNRVVGRRLLPALYVVPVPGVSLDVPEEMRATVDDRPAVLLFDLEDVKYEAGALVRELSDLAGDHLDVRIYHLSLVLLSDAARVRLSEVSAESRPENYLLRAFPSGVDNARAQRWLNRRRSGLLAGWCLLVVLPALVLTVLATRTHELLGVAALLAGLTAAVVAYDQVVTTFSRCLDLVVADIPISSMQLTKGTAVVLPPGSKRGYGKAWLLGAPHVVLLLGDPRTGRLRSYDDLRALSAVLHESPEDADRAAGRQIDELVVQTQTGDPPAEDAAGAAGLWIAVTKAGRAVLWFVVGASVMLTGGSLVENSPFVGPALIIIGGVMLLGWVVYALYRVYAVLAAVWRLYAAGRTGGRRVSATPPTDLP
ncbi:hypothetical protein [Actinoplanes sp. NPDC026619]|uniref:hypothetical protein n=1 Tax=Actinoplanes sp. NPDC026619 TaxID=3155798 RepID=UPI0033FE4BB9